MTSSTFSSILTPVKPIPPTTPVPTVKPAATASPTQTPPTQTPITEAISTSSSTTTSSSSHGSTTTTSTSSATTGINSSTSSSSSNTTTISTSTSSSSTTNSSTTASTVTSLSTNKIPAPSSLISNGSQTARSTAPAHSSHNASSPINHSLSAGIIAGAVIGALFVLAAGIGIFMIVYRRRRRRRLGSLGRISPVEQDMKRKYGLGTSDVDIIPSGIMSQPRERGHPIQTNHTHIPQAEAAAISTSENPEPNLLSLSGSPLPPASTQNQDNADQDDVRTQMERMER
ncbi:hypothetical protein BDP27DRAFT_1450911 [Rhodocollybia butyracea]|uniref:Mid2 domain-containing protein n=1 Tax=Rhodocollybia butyracea TaxID=206335 RepID=A0A9P5PLH3_9AGAR|nr:hypothetical protein BDP27DRAFT_1450911 [Rhodocollybia butyracea]